MDRLKDRAGQLHTRGNPASGAGSSVQDQSIESLPGGAIQAARRRRQLHPFFFRMGPVALSICSVLLIALMAVLYLSQLGEAVTANQQLQDLHRQQTTLQRENQDLVNAIAREESPGYIAARAKAMGLVPADPKKVQVVVVPHLRPIPKDDEEMQP